MEVAAFAYKILLEEFDALVFAGGCLLAGHQNVNLLVLLYDGRG